MSTTLFLAFAAAWILTLAAVLRRHVSPRAGTVFLAAAVPWVAYFLVLGASGLLLRSSDRPLLPLILVPVFVLMGLAAFTRGGGRLAERIPMRMLVGLQAFRILVELFLHHAYRIGLLPEDMTYLGRNFDILTGLTALPFLLLPRLDPGRKGWVLWNLLGLLLLLNVVVTGVLSAPGPLQRLNHATPNLAIAGFPYILVAGLFVASAFVLHILALRKALARERAP